MEDVLSVYKTKIAGFSKKFDLTNPTHEWEYFQVKAGREIEVLKEFLEKNTLVVYLLGKKNSGKGTYSKLFAKIIGPERVDHFSIGDMVRGVDEELRIPEKRRELIKFLEKNYRGTMSLNEILFQLENRSTKELLPTELILSLVKREMQKREKKTIFIDGFPRDLDQIGFSLFFRDLIGYRDDPDLFAIIEVPNVVIDTRIKWRRICPKCQTPKNLKLLPTKEVRFRNGEFYLICDNCHVEMVPKEGDELGIAPIQERLRKEEELIHKALSLHGIFKIILKNSFSLEMANQLFDDYEITPEYYFEIKNKKVKVEKKPWIFNDDQGIPSVSLFPPPVVVVMIRELVRYLGL